MVVVRSRPHSIPYRLDHPLEAAHVIISFKVCVMACAGLQSRTLSRLGDRPGAYGDASPGRALQQAATPTRSAASASSMRAWSETGTRAAGGERAGSMPEMDSASANELQHAVSFKESAFSGAGCSTAEAGTSSGFLVVRGAAAVAADPGADVGSLDELFTAIAGLHESSLRVPGLSGASVGGAPDGGTGSPETVVGPDPLGCYLKSSDGASSLQESVSSGSDAVRQGLLHYEADAQIALAEGAACDGCLVGDSVFSPSNSLHESPGVFALVGQHGSAAKDLPSSASSSMEDLPRTAAGPPVPPEACDQITAPAPSPVTPAAQLREALLSALRPGRGSTPATSRCSLLSLVDNSPRKNLPMRTEYVDWRTRIFRWRTLASLLSFVLYRASLLRCIVTVPQRMSGLLDHGEMFHVSWLLFGSVSLKRRADETCGLVFSRASADEEQELQVPAGVSLEDLIRLAELMQPAQSPASGKESGANPGARDDQRVMRLAQYLLSKVRADLRVGWLVRKIQQGIALCCIDSFA